MELDKNKEAAVAATLAETIVAMQRRIRNNFLITAVILLIMGIQVGSAIVNTRDYENRLAENNKEVIIEASRDAVTQYRYTEGKRGPRGRTGKITYVMLLCTFDETTDKAVKVASCKQNPRQP